MAPRPTFRRYGSSYHLRIRSADDLETIVHLDQAHWVATNAPLSTINCDPTFLEWMDTDANGKIMCHEVTEAIRWLLDMLADRSGIDQRSDILHLDAVATGTEDGKRIHTAALKMLTRLGDEPNDAITLQQVRRVKAQVEAMPVSEGGVVLPAAAPEDQLRQFIADAVTATAGTPHPSGQRGIGALELDRYRQTAANCLDWLQRGRTDEGAASDIMPLGTRTAEAFEVLSEVRAKIDQYFAQCEAAALDERFVQRMGWTERELQDLDFDDPAVIADVLSKAPLAKARATRELRLDEPVNPCYAQALERFAERVAEPVLGESPQVLSSAQWNQIKAFFEAHRAWVEASPTAEVLSIGPQRLQACLSDRLPNAVAELIAASAQTALELDNIRLTEKVILYQAHMLEFVNSFVSFPDLYDPAGRAVYSQDLFDEKIIAFLREHAGEPFFLYHPSQLPHGPIYYPDVAAEVADDPDLTQAEKEYASMVLRLDRTVGLILDELDRLDLSDRTVVIFAADNGHQPYYQQLGRCCARKDLAGQDIDNVTAAFRTATCGDVFDGNDGMAGVKTTNWEGGARIPFIVRWCGHVPAGEVSDHLLANYDTLATLAELVGSAAPPGTDGVSFLPAATGRSDAPQHEHVVYASQYGPSLVSADGWKLRTCLRLDRVVDFPWWGTSMEQMAEAVVRQLYYLPDDYGEENDLAGSRPEKVRELMTRLLRECDGNLVHGTPEAHFAFYPDGTTGEG